MQQWGCMGIGIGRFIRTPYFAPGPGAPGPGAKWLTPCDIRTTQAPGEAERFRRRVSLAFVDRVSPTETLMLELRQVHKTYHTGPQHVAALRGVDLTIDEPGFFAVMGRSGSGKSTLLHLVAGLDRADSGTIVVDGEDVTAMSERRLTEFRRCKVGIVFQQFNLIPTLTAAQNVALPGVIDARPRSWIDERVGELLDRFELSGRADHRPEAMSGGEQQRVATARALLFQPRLLLADEPTGSLDSVSAEHLWRLLHDLADRQEMTVLMVTHEPAAVTNCSKVYVLDDGQVRGDFEVDGLDAGAVASCYQQFGR